MFLPSSYYSDVYEVLKSIFKTDCFTISPVRTKNKKEVKEGIWVFEDFRIYLATPFLELVTKNIFKIFETLNSLFDGIYLKRICCNSQKPKTNGVLISGVFARENDTFLEYEKQPELFSEVLRQYLLNTYFKKYGFYPEDRRFFFVVKGEIEKKVIFSRIEYFGEYEIFASQQLVEMFCQLFCVK